LHPRSRSKSLPCVPWVARLTDVARESEDSLAWVPVSRGIPYAAAVPGIGEPDLRIVT